jgi:hypothetical protein
MSIVYHIPRGSKDVTIFAQLIDLSTNSPAAGYAYDAPMSIYTESSTGGQVGNVAAELGTITTAHTDYGWREVFNGTYRIDLPDAVFATTAPRVFVVGTDNLGGPSVQTEPIVIELDTTTTAFAGQASRDLKAR